MVKMRWWDLLRARSAFGRMIRDIDENITLTLVDVGSVGGIKDRWRLLEGRVHSYCFDPREGATLERSPAEPYCRLRWVARRVRRISTVPASET